MTQEEKEIYSIIFKVALKLSKSPKYIDFAIDMLKIVRNYDGAENDDFTVGWEYLKKYADMENTEETWRAAIKEADDLAKDKSKFRRRLFGTALITELQRRVTGGVR